jgi:hypothetical protein
VADPERRNTLSDGTIPPNSTLIFEVELVKLLPGHSHCPGGCLIRSNRLELEPMVHKSRVACFLTAFTVPLLALSAGLVLAHTDSPGSPPLVPEPLRLKYRKPAEIIALFARERLPNSSGDGIPRAARSDEEESLVPPGVDAVLRTEDPDQVVLVGTEGIPDIRHCIQVLDAPLQRTGPHREKIVLTLRRADARRLRTRVLRLPEAGSAVIRGRQLVLDGRRVWLHRALRQVIRAELREPESTGLRSP